MLKRLLIMRLIHLKKRMKQKPKRTKHCESVTTYKETNVVVKTEMLKDVQKCRVCLKNGHIPIYGVDSTNDLSEDLSKFGDIDVSRVDTYPKYLCQACHDLLQGAILFRKTAQESEKILKYSMNNNSESNSLNEYVDDDDINNYSDDSRDDGNHVKFKYEIKTVKCEKKDTEIILRCERCQLDFETMDEYDTHLRSDEHDTKKVTCTICNKSYHRQYIKKHYMLHKNEPCHICDICGKKFIIKGQFVRHRLTHSINLQFKCSLCPYRGRFSESVKMHMKSHTGEKSYSCHLCPKRFVNTSNLKRHLLVHEGVKNFMCEQCQRGFYTQRELNIHFKYDHSSARDHICSTCGNGYKTHKHLMKHQLKVHKRAKCTLGRTPLYLIEEKSRNSKQSTSSNILENLH